jgi:hypothetical protein
MGAYEAQQVPSFVIGDYNKNGTVDTADYVIWRKMLSMNVPNGTGADGNGDGVVNDDDYGVWRENFGRTSAEVGSGAAGATASSHLESASSPEPGAFFLPPAAPGGIHVGAAATEGSGVGGARRLQRSASAGASGDITLLAVADSRSPDKTRFDLRDDASFDQMWIHAHRSEAFDALKESDLAGELFVALDRAFELLGT